MGGCLCSLGLSAVGRGSLKPGKPSSANLQFHVSRDEVLRSSLTAASAKVSTPQNWVSDSVLNVDFSCAPPLRGLFPAVWRGAGLHAEQEKSWSNVHYLCLPFFGAHLEMHRITLSGVLSPFHNSIVESANAITVNLSKLGLSQKSFAESCCTCLKRSLGLSNASLDAVSIKDLCYDVVLSYSS